MRKIVIVFSLFFGGCSTFSTLSPEEIRESNLQGQWQADDGSWLDIYCSGAVNFRMKSQPNGILGLKTGGEKCRGCSLKGISGSKLEIGPVIETTLSVEKWPYLEKGQTKMALEGRGWKRTALVDCQ